MMRVEKIVFEDSGYAFVLVDEDDRIVSWAFEEDDGYNRLTRIHDALAELAVEVWDTDVGLVAHDLARGLRIKIGELAAKRLEEEGEE